MINSEVPGQPAPCFTVDNILNIMHNILKKKYFDMVSQGYENISSIFGIL